MAGETNQPFPTPGPIKDKIGNKNIRIVFIVAGVLVVILVVLLMMSRRSPGTSIIPQSLTLGGDVSEITLTTEYENPFERDTQYVNPFDEYKSPFGALQQ